MDTRRQATVFDVFPVSFEESGPVRIEFLVIWVRVVAVVFETVALISGHIRHLLLSKQGSKPVGLDCSSVFSIDILCPRETDDCISIMRIKAFDIRYLPIYQNGYPHL